jgi:putative glycosyltransferase (TIGR04372 family)
LKSHDEWIPIAEFQSNRVALDDSSGWIMYSLGMSHLNKMYLWLKRQKKDIKDRGFESLVRKTLKLSFLILITPATLVLLLFGIRFSSGNTNHRIGHLVGEALYMELQRRSGRFFYRYFILLIPRGESANEEVLHVFPKHFVVLRSPVLCRWLYLFKLHPFIRVNMNAGIITSTGAAKIYKYTHLTSKSRPFLSMPNPESLDVKRSLLDVGIPRNGWYVCLHNREVGYSPIDDNLHEYRNSTISNYSKAIDLISEMGGTVVRMGDSSMSKLEGSSKAIDYAHSKLKSPENDLILAVNCRFFLGNSSGIYLLAAAQGIPCVGVNQAPLGVTKFWGPLDIAIPKIYRSLSDSSIIPFSRVFDSKVANSRATSELTELGVFLQENSPDEIAEACREMIRILNGEDVFSEESESQRLFQSFFSIENYSYFSNTRISPYFLKKYRDYI